MSDVVPDFTDPIVGWRGWRIIDGALVSTSRFLKWPMDKPLEAACDQPYVPVERYNLEFGENFQGPSRLRLDVTLIGRVGEIQEVMEAGIVVKYAQGKLTFTSVNREDSDNPAPHADHSCGIYAVPSGSDQIPTIADIHGAVELTGRVVPARHGWRAQRARIVALRRFSPLFSQVRYIANRPSNREIEEIAKAYGVPFVEELPPTTDPKELLP